MAGEACRQGEGHGQGEGAPAAYVDKAGHGQRHERQRVVERGLRGVEDEGARQPELQQAVQQAGRRRRDYAAAHRDEDDGQQLEAHRAALRHHEEAHLPEHGRQGDGDPDLGESLHAPVGGVEVEPRARIEGGRSGAGPVECSSFDLSLRWHYPAAPEDAATSRVVRFDASALGSAFSAPPPGAPQDSPQCTAGATAGPCRVSPHPATVHTPLWRMWIRTFSLACRLTIAVDKTLTTTNSP